jgi:hypothetical protein
MRSWWGKPKEKYERELGRNVNDLAQAYVRRDRKLTYSTAAIKAVCAALAQTGIAQMTQLLARKATHQAQEQL